MKYELGKILLGFQINRSEHIEEINADAYIMEHLQSGAKLLYLDSADDNNVFSIGFRTIPDNSKGTPHIMEHSVLCGSRKFPLKEPFVELAKGSLNTFLNAMTWPDKTMYPVASRNAADFHNLMDVYLDAVFYPNCLKNEQILMQEGWHYELENPAAPLMYNGVVYNEMKGALSSAESIMEEKAMAELFPHTVYGVESGGDPEFIPTLSFREFREFHHKYYHPSNSYIFLYGDMDIEKTLSFLDEEYLSHFEKRHIDSAVGTEPAFSKRKECEYGYGITDGEQEEGKTIHALYLAMHDSMSTVESLALKILNYVLIEADGAPLKKAVIDAGVGNDLSGGYSDSYKQPVWTIEVTGSDPERKEDFAQIIDGELRRLALEGVDKKMLNAALSRAEFIARENDSQGRPKGLFYGIRVMDYWLYDREPLQALRYIDDLQKLRIGVNEGYFESLLVKYAVKNTHQLLITMKPEKGLEEKKNRKTEEKLESYKNSLSEEQISDIIEKTKSLKAYQASEESEEALKSIPLLSRSDLNRLVDDDTLEKGESEGVPHYHYDIHTNGIVYLNLFFAIHGIAAEELPYVHLISNLLKSMDAGQYGYSELDQLANDNTGGVGFSVSAYGEAKDSNQYLPVFAVRCKALTDKTPQMMELLSLIVNETHYDNAARLRELLLEEKAEWDMTVFNRGHALMMTRLTSYFSEIGKFTEQFGMTYYYFLSDLIASFEKDSGSVIKKIQEVSDKIFTQSNLFIQTIGETAEKTAVQQQLPVLLKKMDKGTKGTSKFSFPPIMTNEAFSSSGKVQYVAKGGNFRRHGYEYTGAISVMETILRYEYLWKKVRVLGGAYGAFTQFLQNGTAVICSYRDPNLSETLEAYKELPAYLETLSLSEREMTKYVIGTMAAAEMQLTPLMKGERALQWYLQGITKEDRSRIRNEIIDCTLEDIQKLASLVKSVMDDDYICVMGSETRIRKETGLFHRILSMPQ